MYCSWETRSLQPCALIVSGHTRGVGHSNTYVQSSCRIISGEPCIYNRIVSGLIRWRSGESLVDGERTYQVGVFLAGKEDSGSVVDGGMSSTRCGTGKVNLHLVKSVKKEKKDNKQMLGTSQTHTHTLFYSLLCSVK